MQLDEAMSISSFKCMARKFELSRLSIVYIHILSGFTKMTSIINIYTTYNILFTPTIHKCTHKMPKRYRVTNYIAMCCIDMYIVYYT